MTTYTAGDRVELISTNDLYTWLRPGMLGIVRFVDDLGTIHIAWDDGSRLGMVLDAGDRIRKIG